MFTDAYEPLSETKTKDLELAGHFEITNYFLIPEFRINASPLYLIVQTGEEAEILF